MTKKSTVSIVCVNHFQALSEGEEKTLEPTCSTNAYCAPGL